MKQKKVEENCLAELLDFSEYLVDNRSKSKDFEEECRYTALFPNDLFNRKRQLRAPSLTTRPIQSISVETRLPQINEQSMTDRRKTRVILKPLTMQKKERDINNYIKNTRSVLLPVNSFVSIFNVKGGKEELRRTSKKRIKAKKITLVISSIKPKEIHQSIVSKIPIISAEKRLAKKVIQNGFPRQLRKLYKGYLSSPRHKPAYKLSLLSYLPD